MSDELGFWTVNGSTIFGMMPGGILPGVPDPMPIKLQQGNAYWGAAHIEKRHGQWLMDNKHIAASMVHMKLGQSGTVFSAEEHDKSKIRLTLNPAALLVLKYIPNQNFFSVTSLYLKNSMPDGTPLGRYIGSGNPRAPRVVPVFSAPVVVPAMQAVAPAATPPENVVATLNTPASNGPVIVYKKRRSI